MPFRALLATKLNRAMELTNAPSGRPWKARSLSAAIEGQPHGVSVSHTYIRNLSNGTQDNPSIGAIEAIARALGVPASYFLPSSPDDLDFAVWAAGQEAQYVLRLLAELPAVRRAMIITLAEQCRIDEGLPPIAVPQPEDEPARASQPQRRRWGFQLLNQNMDASTRAAALRGIIDSFEGGRVDGAGVTDEMD